MQVGTPVESRTTPAPEPDEATFEKLMVKIKELARNITLKYSRAPELGLGMGGTI